MQIKKRLITAGILGVAMIMIVIAVAIVAGIFFLRSSSDAVAMPGVTKVGVPNGPATTRSIGQAGGSIASPDGRIVVEVPPNAVAGQTDFSIQPITNLAHGGVGTAYRLEPSGQKFEPPIKVSFKFDAQDLKAYSPEALAIAYQDPTGVWQSYKTVNIDQASKTLTVSTTHFTDLSLWTVRLSPEKATLRLGETQLIAVEGCKEEVGWGYKIKNLLGIQTCRFFMPRENSWSVNVGTITMVPGAVLYTAPTKKPSLNVATVRLVYRLRGSEQKDVRTCEITIVGQAYSANGKAGDTVFSGDICDLDKHFTLKTSNPFLSSFEFDPDKDSPTKGKWSFSTATNSVIGGGGGEYTITGTDTLKTGIELDGFSSAYGQGGGRRTPTLSGGGSFHLNLVPLDRECKR